MQYAYRVPVGSKIKLSDIDPDEHGGLTPEAASEKIEKAKKHLFELQELLYAAQTHSLLIVLQGRDTSGKDGSIRHISTYLNTLSTTVTPFKVPTALEARHDFLWRIHANVPAKGDVAIFNRSHYEDVLAVRVHNLAPEKVWKPRYKEINHFESLLSDSGTLIVKIYLHISKKEQEKRLLAREEDPEKAWKLSVGDWKERETWSEMTKAYEDVLEKCNTEDAPWYVVPANHKWFRDLAIAHVVKSTLAPHEDQWRASLKERGKTQTKAIAEYRASLGVK